MNDQANQTSDAAAATGALFFDAGKLVKPHFSVPIDAPSKRFDRVMRLARRTFNVSHSALSLFIGGAPLLLTDPELDFGGAPRDVALFGRDVPGGQLLVLQDAWDDARFQDNPLVTGQPRVRFYAAVQLRDPEGRPIGRLAVFDPRPRRFADEDRESLRDLGRMLEYELDAEELGDAVAAADARDTQARRLQKEAVSLASHELRQPLAVMRTALSAIEQFGPSLSPEKAAEFFNMASRNAARLSELVDRYLDLAKLESGELEIKSEPVRLAPLIAGVARDLEAVFAARGIRYLLAAPKSELAVQADPNRLVEVLSNLLSNAGKFSPSGGLVAVSWKNEGGFAKISVSDRGPGIKPDFRDRVFGKFSQDRSIESGHEMKGSGLGLSIAKAIVERMGGTIGFETEVGRGTTFAFTLPLVEAPAVHEAPRAGLAWAFAAAALLFAASPARAARAVGVRDAIDAAIESNLTTKLAKADTDAARAQALQAASALLPNVLGTASQSRVLRENLASLGLSGGPIPSLIGPFNVFDARLRLTQTVFDLSSINRVRAAGAGKELALRQEEAAREQISAAAALAYVEALRSRKSVEAARADDELARRLLAQAQDQEKAGTATGVDVVRAKTRAASASVGLLQAQVGERDATIRLARVAGWGLGEAFVFSEELSTAVPAAQPLDEALSQAQQARPELAAAREEARLEGLLLTAAQSERAPKITANADVGLSGNQPDSGARATGSIGAGISLPIFSGGMIQGRVDAARAEKTRSQARLADAVVQVEEDVRLAYENLSEAQQQVVAADQTRSLAEQELRMAEDQYEAGTRDNVAVVTAQTELAQARTGFVAALAGEHDARINLAAALGAARGFRL